jgi:hypothetical protein
MMQQRNSQMNVPLRLSNQSAMAEHTPVMTEIYIGGTTVEDTRWLKRRVME